MKKYEKIILILLFVLSFSFLTNTLMNKTAVSTLPATGADLTPVYIVLAIAIIALIIYLIIRARSKKDDK